MSLCWAARIVCGGVGRVMWHAGDMAGARVVVDIGDMAVWLLHLCGCRVSFAGGCHGSWAAGVVIGGGAYLWVMWWQGAVVVVEVGCGRKKDTVSQTVTHVTFRTTFKHARACTIMLTLNVHFCSIHYTVL